MYFLRFLIISIVIWLVLTVLRLIVGKSARSSHRDGNIGTASKDTVKDPVCGMYMDRRLAIQVKGREGDVFFCSEECRERYLETGR